MLIAVSRALPVAAALVACGLQAAHAAGTVKVFILAGQSNMEGHGHVRTLARLGERGQRPDLLARVRRDDGSLVVRDDVFVYFRGGKVIGRLTAGFGADAERIGPELMFGAVMGDAVRDPVLLIKTAWGGKDLHFDFRPPSAGKLPYPIDPEALKERGGEQAVGASYRQMVADVRDCLENMGTYFPALEGRGYEIAGFVWFQGWNEMFPSKGIPFERILADYPALYATMVGDLEKDLGVARLPSVVGEMGVNGDGAEGKIQELRKAQAAIALRPELAGKVSFVRTAPFWDPMIDDLRERERAIVKLQGERLRERVAARIAGSLEGKPDSERRDALNAALDQAVRETPEHRAWQAEWDRVASHWECHYFGSARTHSLIGNAFAGAMMRLLGVPPPGL